MSTIERFNATQKLERELADERKQQLLATWQRTLRTLETR